MTTLEGPLGMTDNTGASGVAIRCSTFAREQDVRMLGSAGRYNGYLLMPWPMPWPADADDVAELAPLRAGLRARGIRLQLVHPLTTRLPRPGAVLYLRTDPFCGFQRVDVYGDDPVGQAGALLAGNELAAITDDVVDVLVCGHGSRDVCCGSLGVRLASEAAAHPSLDLERVRLWRTSHTGGHRFAPTAISLPDGMVWGRVDLPALEHIALRTGSAGRLSAYARGCSGLQSAAAQLLDARAFQHHGWEWLTWRRRDEVVNENDVRLTGTAPDGKVAVWEGVIASGRELPVPVCRAPLSAATKTETELELAAFRYIPSAEPQPATGR
jgi:hypothetical protein